jgi:peptidoglycan hydrolase-like protein with peptidoglycan-binding domain
MAKTQRFLAAPVGYGLDNQKQDVTAAKRKLQELGFYAPRNNELGDDFDEGFDTAIQNFQSRAGLRVDGVMKPGGETERNIEAYRTGEGFEALPQAAEMQVRECGLGRRERARRRGRGEARARHLRPLRP